MALCWFRHWNSGARSALPKLATMDVQFIPEASPLTARLEARLLALPLELPMLVNVLVAIIFTFSILFRPILGHRHDITSLKAKARTAPGAVRAFFHRSGNRACLGQEAED